MENRDGLAVDASPTPAAGFAEWGLGDVRCDKSYDTRDFVDGLRGLTVARTWPSTLRSGRVRSIAAPRATPAIQTKISSMRLRRSLLFSVAC
jgi:hypothetical protein